MLSMCDDAVAAAAADAFPSGVVLVLLWVDGWVR